MPLPRSAAIWRQVGASAVSTASGRALGAAIAAAPSVTTTSHASSPTASLTLVRRWRASKTAGSYRPTRFRIESGAVDIRRPTLGIRPAGAPHAAARGRPAYAGPSSGSVGLIWWVGDERWPSSEQGPLAPRLSGASPRLSAWALVLPAVGHDEACPAVGSRRPLLPEPRRECGDRGPLAGEGELLLDRPAGLGECLAPILRAVLGVVGGDLCRGGLGRDVLDD